MNLAVMGGGLLLGLTVGPCRKHPPLHPVLILTHCHGSAVAKKRPSDRPWKYLSRGWCLQQVSWGSLCCVMGGERGGVQLSTVSPHLDTCLLGQVDQQGPSTLSHPSRFPDNRNATSANYIAYFFPSLCVICNLMESDLSL